MADLPSQADLFAAGRREAILSPTRFDRAIVDTVGSDVNVILNVAGAQGEEVARFAQISINEISLANAQGEALDRFIFDRYQLRRKDAAAAVVILTLTRADTSVALVVPSGSSFYGSSGVQYKTQQDVPFPVGQGGPLSVLAVADQTGIDGNTGAGTITKSATTFATEVTANNVLAAAGGSDRESDDVFRARARDFYATARRGTRAAIEFGALQAARVVQAQAIEVFNQSTGLPGYRVGVYVADASGQGNSAMVADVELEMDEYRALGVPVSARYAIPQYVEVQWTGLLYQAGTNTTQAQADVRSACIAYVSGLQPGETLRRAKLIEAAAGVTGVILPDGALVEPTGDLVPIVGHAIRTTKDRVTFT